MEPRLGEPAPLDRVHLCGHARTPGDTRCLRPAALHVLIRHPQRGEQEVAPCLEHYGVAVATGEWVAEHEFRDWCGFPGARWDLVDNVPARHRRDRAVKPPRWWPWRRPEPRYAWSPPGRIPDGDTVLQPGQRRWADLLDQHAPGSGDWLTEPTQPLPVYRPLLTPGQAWRSQGGDQR